MQFSKELFKSGQGVQAVVPSPRSQRSAADVTQGAVNWAQMGKPNTNQPQMQEGAQPHRFCQDLARSSVRHGHEVGRAMKRGPFLEPELREHLDEHLAQSERHGRVKLVQKPNRQGFLSFQKKGSARAKNWQIEAGFLSAQKVTLGAGSCRLGAVFVAQWHGDLLFRKRPAMETAVNRLGPGQEGSARAKHTQIRHAVAW